MKKKLLIVLSFIMVFVLCFFTACTDKTEPPKEEQQNDQQNEQNKDDKNDKEEQQTVSYTPAKGVAAFEKLAETEGLKGAISFEASVGEETVSSYNLQYDKRETQVKMVLAGETPESSQEMVYDLEKGNMYAKVEGGYNYLGSSVPQGLYDFIDKLDYSSLIEAAGGSAGTNAAGPTAQDIENAFAKVLPYDKETNTLNAELDLAASVNNLFAPAFAVYNDNGTLTDLINAYLTVMTGSDQITLKYILNTVKTLLSAPDTQNLKISELLAALDQILGLTEEEENLTNMFDAFLNDAYKSSPDKINTAKNRTVCDLLRAAYAFVIDSIPKTPDAPNTDAGQSSGNEAATTAETGDQSGTAPDQGTASGGSSSTVPVQEILLDLLDYMLVRDISDKAYPDLPDLDTILTDLTTELLAYTDGTDFKALIDGLDDKNSMQALVKTVIVNQVTFNELNAKLVVTLNDKLEIIKIHLEGNVAHSYAPKNNIPFLSLNDYCAKLDATVTEYTEETQPFEITFAPTSKVQEEVDVIVCGEDTGDIEVYFETSGKTLTDFKYTVCARSSEGDKKVTGFTQPTFDPATKTFKINRDVLTKITEAGYEISGAYIRIDYTCNGQPDYSFINIVYFPDHNAETLINMLKEKAGTAA